MQFSFASKNAEVEKYACSTRFDAPNPMKNFAEVLENIPEITQCCNEFE